MAHNLKIAQDLPMECFVLEHIQSSLQTIVVVKVRSTVRYRLSDSANGDILCVVLHVYSTVVR